MNTFAAFFTMIIKLFTTTTRLINTVDAVAEMAELTATGARDDLIAERADSADALKAELAARKAARKLAK